MKERRFYQVLILILVLLNIGVISFFLLSKNPPPERNRRRMDAGRMLDRRLGLDESQKQNLDTLRRSHFNQMRTLQQEIMQHKRALYQEMKSENLDQAAVDSLTRNLGHLHQQMERVNFYHFRQIRQQLDPYQVERYDSLLMRIFRRDRRDPPRRGRN